MDEQPRFYAEAASEHSLRPWRSPEPYETADYPGDFDWEVLDCEAIASRRVLCRATKARAVMIAEALNAAVPDSDLWRLRLPPHGNTETDREFKIRLGRALVFVSDEMAGEDLDLHASIFGLVRK